MTKLIIVIIFMISVTYINAKDVNDVNDAKELFRTCSMCHGQSGEGKMIYPSINQYKSSQLETLLKDYRDGKKNNKIMYGYTSNLTDKNIKQLSKYIESLKNKK